MNRRVYFRGYNLKNKKWLYGYYLVNRGKHYIVQDEVVNPFAEESDFEVDPESVGQYVGDYKGKPIYEGDMVRVTETGGRGTTCVGLVVHDTINCRFAVNKRYQVGGLGGCEKILITGEEQTIHNEKVFMVYEVIGNEYEENKIFQDREKISNP